MTGILPWRTASSWRHGSSVLSVSRSRLMSSSSSWTAVAESVPKTYKVRASKLVSSLETNFSIKEGVIVTQVGGRRVDITPADLMSFLVSKKKVNIPPETLAKVVNEIEAVKVTSLSENSKLLLGQAKKIASGNESNPQPLASKTKKSGGTSKEIITNTSGSSVDPQTKSRRIKKGSSTNIESKDVGSKQLKIKISDKNKDDGNVRRENIKIEEKGTKTNVNEEIGSKTLPHVDLPLKTEIQKKQNDIGLKSVLTTENFHQSDKVDKAKSSAVKNDLKKIDSSSDVRHVQY